MSPGHVLGSFMVFWLLVFGTLILYRLLSGQINLRGLLTDGRDFTPTRLQTLVLTIGGLLAYVTASLSAHKLMSPPAGTWLAYTASHVLYLGAKTRWAFFRG